MDVIIFNIGELCFFDSVAQEWDELHLHIENNLDWMNVWIEICKNIMKVGYHGNDCLNWLEKLVITKMPMLRKGKLI